jgi:hypothetical protein
LGDEYYRAIAMNRYVLVLFAVIGLLDLLYGLFFQDRISIIVGLLITGIAIYAIKSKT